MGGAEPRPVLPEATFRLLREQFHGRFGLWFHDDLRFLLEARLGPRLALHGLRDFDAYQRFLRLDPRGPSELFDAAEVLTTNETYFYREPDQLRAFEREILPALEKERGGERRLRLLSAGCATGEEVYTLAALLLGSKRFEGWQLEVHGVDLSRRCLARALAGAYGEHAFRSAEGQALRRWFHLREGRWVVDDALRRLVHFGAANLLDGEGLPPAPFDVIFCRNVMLYFDPAARRRALRHLHALLGEGGWLLLGHAESLLELSADFELVHLERELVFRKPRVAAGATA
jgi:chemotaxis protein methyltransferase CheR